MQQLFPAEGEAVPKLRFSEFLEAGEWGIKPLGESCDILNNLRKPITGSNREKGFYRYYGASGIVDYVKDYIFDEKLLLIGEDGAKWGAFEKTAFIVTGKYWVNNHVHVLRVKMVNDIFLENYIIMLDIAPFITGAAPPKLTLKNLKKIPIPVPQDKKEQQKIADCLSSIDDLITAQAQKIESLKDHKKGLMQQLFPAEGETVPKLRFPEFLGMGKWEEKILGCVSDVRDGTHDSPKFYRKGRLLITSKNLLPNGELDLVNANLISEQDYKQINKRSKVDIGDIIFGMIGTIGNPVRVRTEGYAIKNVALVKQKKELLNSYLVQFLNSEYIAREFSILNSGNSQKFISLGKIRSLSFPTPPITEQQKIADCLSSIDDLITAQAKKIELLKDHKKGLMQQLFPVDN